MRSAFVEALVEEAERDPRILLLTADLGFGALEPFRDRFPGRFFNVGVAEQNMIGVATGLAEAGFVPFAYSIATFASMRPYEFIRNGPVLHHLPVRVVGVGGGVDYGTNGLTHYALEDVALMRAQPDLTVIVPADAEQARTAVRASATIPGPLYLRLEKQGRPVPGLRASTDIARAQLVRPGRDVCLVAMGGISYEAVLAADLLSARGVEAAVLVVSTVSPPPVDDILSALAGIPLALTLESHYLNGGVGSLVSEVVAAGGIGCRVVRCGIERTPRGETGSRDALYELHRLHAAGIAARAESALDRVT